MSEIRFVGGLTKRDEPWRLQTVYEFTILRDGQRIRCECAIDKRAIDMVRPWELEAPRRTVIDPATGRYTFVKVEPDLNDPDTLPTYINDAFSAAIEHRLAELGGTFP